MRIIIFSGTGLPAREALSVYNTELEHHELLVVMERRNLRHSLTIIKNYLRRFGALACLDFIALQVYLLFSKREKQAFINPPTVESVDSINSEASIQTTLEYQPELIITNACSILNKNTLARLEGKLGVEIINVHNGITPRYRGTGNLWAVTERNVGKCGVTVHRVDQGIDTGQIIVNKQISPTAFPGFDAEVFRVGAQLVCDYIKNGSGATNGSRWMSSCYYSYPGLTHFIDANRIIKQRDNALPNDWQHWFNDHATDQSLSALEQQAWTNPRTVDWHDTKVLELLDLKGNDGTLLDLGCGDARLGSRYSGQGYYLGVDYSLNLLRNTKSDRVTCCDVQALPFSAGSIQTCVCIGVLQHVVSPGEVIDEIARVTTADGFQVIINTLREFSLFELLVIYTASIVFTQYHQPARDQLRFKFARKQHAQFNRFKASTLSRQLKKLFRSDVRIIYNGALGTRLFATEIIAEVKNG